MDLAEEQIKAAFAQSEKEVQDLHTRISQGMRESRKNGTQIGLSKGTTLVTEKSVKCKEIIKQHATDFGGMLSDTEVRFQEILTTSTNHNSRVLQMRMHLKQAVPNRHRAERAPPKRKKSQLNNWLYFYSILLQTRKTTTPCRECYSKVLLPLRFYLHTLPPTHFDKHLQYYILLKLLE